VKTNENPGPPSLKLQGKEKKEKRGKWLKTYPKRGGGGRRFLFAAEGGRRLLIIGVATGQRE